MAFLRIVFLFVTVIFVGAFFTDDANAHAGHGHGHVVTDTDIKASSSEQQKQNHDKAAKAHSDHMPHGGGVICQYGCCSGACVACCVTLSSVFGIDHPGYHQSDNQAWRHYETSVDALNLPYTPPPRV